MICFLSINRQRLVQCIYILRFIQTFSSYVPFLATTSTHILENNCTTLLFRMTRYCSTVVTLRLFRRWAFGVTATRDVGCIPCPTDLLLISTDLPHKPSHISRGFIVLSYLYNSPEFHNVSLLVAMTITVQLSLQGSLTGSAIKRS